jgi:hypothetical protein
MDDTRGGGSETGSALAEAIVARAPRDLVFVMQFVGETQYQVLKYFQDLVIRELESRGIRREDNALLQIFIDKHATEMRDFVFSGVALSRPFRIEEIERLMGDTTNVIRSDIWDAVLAIGEANGARQRAQAGASGARIELMTLEDHGGPEATEAAVAAARVRAEQAEAGLAEAASRIAALDDRLAALDRELAEVVR